MRFWEAIKTLEEGEIVVGVETTIHGEKKEHGPYFLERSKSEIVPYKLIKVKNNCLKPAVFLSGCFNWDWKLMERKYLELEI